MTGPMALLGLCCLCGGLVPLLLVRLVSPAVGSYGGISRPLLLQQQGLIPLLPLSLANITLLVLAGIIGAVYVSRLRALPRAPGVTWGCGFQEPTPRMQYTGTSFSELIVNQLGALVGPRLNKPDLSVDIFPRRAKFGYEVSETVLERLIAPLFQRVGTICAQVRRLQHGRLHVYILYIFATLFVLMAWAH